MQQRKRSRHRTTVQRKKIVRHARRRAPVKQPEVEVLPLAMDNRGYDAYSLIFGYDFIDR
jgi:hypothetical protein